MTPKLPRQGHGHFENALGWIGCHVLVAVALLHKLSFELFDAGHRS
jgi:hypothetical protein